MANSEDQPHLKNCPQHHKVELLEKMSSLFRDKLYILHTIENWVIYACIPGGVSWSGNGRMLRFGMPTEPSS